MFERECTPSLIKRHHDLRTKALLFVMLALPVWSGCDELAAGGTLSRLLSGGGDTAPAPQTARVNLAESEGVRTETAEPTNPSDPEPGDLPCVDALGELTRGCVQETHNIAAGCVELITQLFLDEQLDEAHEAARGCIEQINQHTEDCLRALREECRLCVEGLIDDGAPMEVIEAVLRACREFSSHILHARRAAVEAVENAVDRGAAHRCAQVLHQLAGECAEENGRIAADCVTRIEELLEQELTQEAVEAAHTCIREIRHHSAGCARAIGEHSRTCVQRLSRRCANEELIQLVREAREQSIHLVFRSAREAVRRIRESLPPPPPPGNEGPGEGLQGAS